MQKGSDSMISHPLIKKEWKLLKWIMLLFACIFGFFTMLLNNSMAQNKIYHLMSQGREGIFISQLYRLNWGMVPMLLMALMVVVAVLFVHDRNIHIGRFISSLPYTRKEYFKIKYLMGVVTFTVPLVLYGLVLYAIRGRHLDWMSRIYQYAPQGELLKHQDSLGVLVLWSVFLWLVMLAVYSFLMLVQTLVGQNIVASIIGGIVILVPVFLGHAIPANLSLLLDYHLDLPERLIKWTQIFLLGNPETSLAQRTLALNTHTFMGTYTTEYTIYNYRMFPVYMLILAAIIVGSVLLSNRSITKYDVEKNGEIAIYPWVAKLLVIGVTVCSLLLFPILIVIFTGIESPILTIVVMIIGGALGYLISRKSIELTTRQG